MATRYSFVATICDPRYKLIGLVYLFKADRGVNSVYYKKAKVYFEHVYSQYSRRAVGLKEFDRLQAANAAIDVRGSRSLSPKIEDRES